MNRLLAVSLALPLLLATLVGCPGESDDNEGPVANDPSQLKAPATGQGFQFRTPLFQVGPGEEVQDCYFFRVRDLAKSGGLPENEPVNLHRVQLVQRHGSHHMNLFRVKTVKGLNPEGGISRGLNGQGECFKSPNWSDWPLVANTQVGGALDWTFPDGVANVFQPDEWIMLQTHYVNASSQKTPDQAEVAINWHTMPKEKVQHEMGTLFATKQSIRVCKSNPTPEFSGTCQFKNTAAPVNVIGANGHFHGRGKTFDMYSWDGTSISKPADAARFYRSESWDEPPMKRSPELSLQIQPGGGVYFTCGYEWRPPLDEIGGCKALDDVDKSPEKDCCYTFGPIVEKNEHCNVFVYYWPKVADVGDIACN
jgi:hypothetical protein